MFILLHGRVLAIGGTLVVSMRFHRASGGMFELTRILLAPHTLASTRVIASTASCVAEETTDWGGGAGLATEPMLALQEPAPGGP
jgi:hypothetical protein